MTELDSKIQSVVHILELHYKDASTQNLSTLKERAQSYAEQQALIHKSSADKIRELGQTIYRKTYEDLIAKPFQQRLEESTQFRDRVANMAETIAKKEAAIREAARAPLVSISTLAQTLTEIENPNYDSSLDAFDASASAQMEALREYNIDPILSSSLIEKMNSLQSLQNETRLRIVQAKRVNATLSLARSTKQINDEAVKQLNYFDISMEMARKKLKELDYEASDNACKQAKRYLENLKNLSEELSKQTKDFADKLALFGSLQPGETTILHTLNQNAIEFNNLEKQIEAAKKITNGVKNGHFEGLSPQDFEHVPESVYDDLKDFIMGQIRLSKNTDVEPQVKSRAIQFRQQLILFLETLQDELAKKLNVPGLQKSFCEKLGEFIAWLLSFLGFGPKALEVKPVMEHPALPEAPSLQAYYGIEPSQDDASDDELL